MIKKNKYLLLYVILLLYIFVLLFIFWLPVLVSKKIKTQDLFTNKQGNQTIILLGDSILNNTNYVKPGDSIDSILKSQLDPSIILLSFAQDGATIFDVFGQFDNISLDSNNSNSYIFLSAGGNDILNAEFTKLNINIIFDKYIKLINALTTRFPYINIIALTLYYPISIKYEKYRDIITIWNAKIKKLMGNNTISLKNIIQTSEDITNNIEPSFIGGQKIVNAILEKI